MDDIRAGVTLMQDFCVSRSLEFQSYIDYMVREEAQRNQAFQTFNVFHDYMENPEKSTGLFTATKDHLTMDEKKELKEIFQTAQNNESLMWQTVISFDNRWLEKNHVYDSKHGILDEKKLKEVARTAIGTMLEKEGMDLAVWTASFHYNTDNIHIHFATVEPYPTRELMIYQGKIERRGKFKRKNIEAAKSKVVNELMQTREINQKINQTIRQDIVKAKEQRSLAENPVFREKFLALYENLPNIPQNMITYNNSIMSRQRKQIDEISKLYLETYHAAEYIELKALLKRQSELYSEAYGFGQTDRSYAEGKEKELLERLGNAVLREVKQYARNMKKAIGQTVEENHSIVSGWSVSGIGRRPIFGMDEWKRETEQKPIIVDKGEQKPLQNGEQEEEKNTVERELDFQDGAQLEVSDYEVEWIEDTQEEKLGQSLKIQPIEKTYSEEAQEALYDMEQFLQTESQGGIEGEPQSNGDEKKGDCLSEYQVWYEEFKEIRDNLATEKGIYYFQQLAEKGNQYAQYQLGVLHLDPELPFFDLQKGLSFLKEAAEQGNQYAQYQLGKFYLKPDTLSFDLETGIFYLECAAEQGNENAVYLLGKSYLDPKLEIYDPAKGEGYLIPLAAKGNQYAQYQLGKLYLDPSISFRDPQRGLSFLKEAAEQGNQYAQVKLGLEYLKNENLGRNLAEARLWLGKAAEQGNELADKILNDLHTQGISRRIGRKSGAGELDRALRYLQQSLEEEHWRSLQILRQYELGQAEELQEELG